VTLTVVEAVTLEEGVAVKLGDGVKDNEGTTMYCIQEGPALIVSAFKSRHCASEVNRRV